METILELKEWKLTNDPEKGKIINGEFQVKAGATAIAKQVFNTHYSEVKIPFPAALQAKVEALDGEIEAFIIKHFTGKESQ
jgi:hypothetical protein